MRSVAQIVVTSTNVMVKSPRDGVGDGPEIFVAAISRSCQHDDAPAGDIEAAGKIGHHADGMRIVSVIEQSTLKGCSLNTFMRPGAWKKVELEGTPILAGWHRA